jgi:hypothetical protein
MPHTASGGQSWSRPVSVGPAGSPRTRGKERSRPRQRPTHWCPVETADRGDPLVVAKVGDGVIRDVGRPDVSGRAAPVFAIGWRVTDHLRGPGAVPSLGDLEVVCQVHFGLRPQDAEAVSPGRFSRASEDPSSLPGVGAQDRHRRAARGPQLPSGRAAGLVDSSWRACRRTRPRRRAH